MAETETTNATASIDTAAPAAAEEENVFLLYANEKGNAGSGEFVMHGVNLFFRRGVLTGPVTATVAGIVTGRKKPPVIRVASEAEIKALQPKEEKPAGDGEDKSAHNSGDKSGDGSANTSTSSDGKGGSAGEGGMTAPDDPKPDASPATERKPKQGTKLTTG